MRLGCERARQECVRQRRQALRMAAAQRRASHSICGQTKSAAKLTGAARSVAQPGQRRTLEALRQPDRTRGVPSNLSSWSGGVRWTLSSRSDHSYSTTRATGGVVPASSKHTPSLSQSAYIQFSDLYCMAQPQHCRGLGRFQSTVASISGVSGVKPRCRSPMQRFKRRS